MSFIDSNNASGLQLHFQVYINMKYVTVRASKYSLFHIAFRYELVFFEMGLII